MTRPAGYIRVRKAPRPWVCPLCERKVTGFTMWEAADDINAIYFHGDNERHFVANHQLAPVVSQIGEIGFPRENTGDDNAQETRAADDSAADRGDGRKPDFHYPTR